MGLENGSAVRRGNNFPLRSLFRFMHVDQPRVWHRRRRDCVAFRQRARWRQGDGNSVKMTDCLYFAVDAAEKKIIMKCAVCNNKEADGAAAALRRDGGVGGRELDADGLVDVPEVGDGDHLLGVEGVGLDRRVAVGGARGEGPVGARVAALREDDGDAVNLAHLLHLVGDAAVLPQVVVRLVDGGGGGGSWGVTRLLLMRALRTMAIAVGLAMVGTTSGVAVVGCAARLVRGHRMGVVAMTVSVGVSVAVVWSGGSGSGGFTVSHFAELCVL